jgi:hypothetical protein
MSARREPPDDAEASDQASVVVTGAAPPELRSADDLPVVARLVVEIRSDGRRTIARGAMEDAATGKSVALEARGDSPVQLAMSLARSVFSLPALARTAARNLLPGRRRRR